MKLILNGLSLDKRMMHSVIQKMEGDEEINKLIKMADYKFDLIKKSFFNLWVMMVALGVLLEIFLNLLYLGFSINILTLIPIIWITLKIINLVRGIKNSYFSIRSNIDFYNYLESQKAPKKPFDLWGFFISNLSDSHSIIPTSKLFQEDIKYIYCGKPYYEIEFIDSILISFSPEIDKKHKLKKKFVEFYKKHAEVTFENEFKKEYFDYTNKRLLQSRYVFGIYFLSNFLYYIIENGSMGKFNFIFSKQINNNKKEFAKECIKLSGDPEITLFNEHNLVQNCIEITIENVFITNDEIPKTIAKNEILIPFKRYIGLPTKYIEENGRTKKIIDGDLVLPEIPALKNNNIIDVYSLGGAEHNLPLLHIVNCHRYLLKNNRTFGIAENRFDYSSSEVDKSISFKIGASHFVYGINTYVRHSIIKDIKKDHSNQAEVFRLNIKYYDMSYNIFCFYGYSAPMTRIAFLKFLHETKNNNLIIEDKSLRLFKVDDVDKDGNKTNFYDSDFLHEWDRLDCMNEPEKFKDILDKVKIYELRHDSS